MHALELAAPAVAACGGPPAADGCGCLAFFASGAATAGGKGFWPCGGVCAGGAKGSKPLGPPKPPAALTAEGSDGGLLDLLIAPSGCLPQTAVAKAGGSAAGPIVCLVELLRFPVDAEDLV